MGKKKTGSTTQDLIGMIIGQPSNEALSGEGETEPVAQNVPTIPVTDTHVEEVPARVDLSEEPPVAPQQEEDAPHNDDGQVIQKKKRRRNRTQDDSEKKKPCFLYLERPIEEALCLKVARSRDSRSDVVNDALRLYLQKELKMVELLEKEE